MTNVGAAPGIRAAVEPRLMPLAEGAPESVFSVGTMVYTRRTPGPSGHELLQRHIATRCTNLTSATFDGAVELARERARADRVHAAQGVFQAVDGSYFVSSLGYRTPSSRWVPHVIDGPRFEQRFSGVRVEPAIPIFGAVVGADSIIDLR